MDHAAGAAEPRDLDTPAPGGAGIALIPLLIWLGAGDWPMNGPVRNFAHQPLFVSALLIVSAFLMIANLPSWSWRALRIAPRHRITALLVIGLLFTALLTQPWETLCIIAIGYLLVIPLAWWRYAQIKARRAGATLH